jgi:ADP-ribosylglycohydrolase
MSVNERLARARQSLEGLSVGDAFGERFFISPLVALQKILDRVVPKAPWSFTDDTIMAVSIVETLQVHACIEQDDLASRFATRYLSEPWRGYGGTAHSILRSIAEGEPWHRAAGRAFGGEGSKGNGAAMRVAPVGAYFAENLTEVVTNAAASAEVTHAHDDGIAGAIAVAVAAATAWQLRETDPAESTARLFEAVLAHTPKSPTRAGILRAAQLPLQESPQVAAELLGSGELVISSDTVPFCIWCAARHLQNYEEAIWTTVAGLGDRDTTCAIVGGIVALSSRNEIPEQWRTTREPLPS